MAVNFNDPTCGFFQREVVDFLNKQILRNGVSPHFYLIQMCESWGDMEKKLRDILTDSAMSGAMKESCAWRTLALAVRLAEKQKREDTRRMRKLQDQLYEQKLFTNVLVGMVDNLRKTQEKEKEKAQTQLQQSLMTLRGLEQERNTLRNELFR
ncbi:TX13B protein, partial [Crocuta crocuta]